jgi:hypothetical protein
MPRGPVDFFFWEGPFAMRPFPTAFLVMRGSRTSTLTNQSLVGTSKMYTTT